MQVLFCLWYGDEETGWCGMMRQLEFNCVFQLCRSGRVEALIRASADLVLYTIIYGLSMPAFDQNSRVLSLILSEL